MKISNALLRACLLASVPIATFAQTPVVVEAESGALGASHSVGTLGDVTYITGLNGTDNPTPARTASYQVIFPTAGNYDLYVRIRIGADVGNDDSFYISNGFNNLNWQVYNNRGTEGFTAPGDTIIVGGTATNLVFKWVKLTNDVGRTGGLGPNAWVVPADSLTQTFNWGSREDGLFFDKFAFGPQGTCYTVAELNAGAPGTATCRPPPPPPPPAFTFPGPPIATGEAKFLGSAWSPGTASFNFLNYWNKVTPENASKWDQIEFTRDVYTWANLDTVYNLAKNNGLPFHYHVLFWGNQQPPWIDDLPVEEQLEEIHELLALVSARYPDIDILEVVNEPLHDPPCTRENGGGGYCDALGGRGTPEERAANPDREWLWISNAFKLARQYFPNAKLMLNDFSIENETPQTTRYLQIIKLLQAEGLIDIIGVQGHAFSQSEPAPMPTYRSNLDRLAQRLLPIHVTELDVTGTDDAVQLANMQKIFPLYWEHPAVKGVTMWGYMQCCQWRRATGDWLIWDQAGSLGAERPAMQWLHRYVGNTLPTLGNRYFRISGSAPNGAVVGTLTALDPDAGTVISAWQAETTGGYAGVNGNGVFALDANGVLTVTNAAALAAAPPGFAFKLFVSVWDGFQRTRPMSIEIFVD